MIYLHRYSTSDEGDTTIDIAACEDARGVPRYEAQGYARCTSEAFRVAWRERDARARARIAVEDWFARQNEPAPGVPPGTAIGKTAGGLTVYKGDK